MRKVPETFVFQALGIIDTLGSIISHGTLKKFADVRTHLRKVFQRLYLQSEAILKEDSVYKFFLFLAFLVKVTSQ